MIDRHAVRCAPNRRLKGIPFSGNPGSAFAQPLLLCQTISLVSLLDADSVCSIAANPVSATTNHKPIIRENEYGCQEGSLNNFRCL